MVWHAVQTERADTDSIVNSGKEPIKGFPLDK
jgi:hypothetical protein